jgi:hypothetical protein
MLSVFLMFIPVFFMALLMWFDRDPANLDDDEWERF